MSCVIAAGLASVAQATVASNIGVSLQKTTVFNGTTTVPAYQLGIAQSLGASDIDTSTWFTLTAVSGDTTHFNFRAADHNLDEGSDWYLAPQNADFTPASISASQFTPLVVGNTFYGTRLVPNGGTFFLAYDTGLLPAPTRGEAIGWVQLQNLNGTLSLVSSAAAYNEPGLRVGTTTVVPEPAAVGLLLTAAPLLWRRRA